MMTPEAHAKLLAIWKAACAKPVPLFTGSIVKVKDKKYIKWLKEHQPRDYGENPIKRYFDKETKCTS